MSGQREGGQWITWLPAWKAWDHILKAKENSRSPHGKSSNCTIQEISANKRRKEGWSGATQAHRSLPQKEPCEEVLLHAPLSQEETNRLVSFLLPLDTQEKMCTLINWGNASLTMREAHYMHHQKVWMHHRRESAQAPCSRAVLLTGTEILGIKRL